MKYLSIILFFVSSSGFGQLTLSEAKTAALEYNVRSYSYHVKFEGHEGYAAPIILIADGGTIFFGDSEDDKSVNIVKLDKDGNAEWQSHIRAKFDEMETQSIIQDQGGYYYAFVLSYDYSKYRGSCERVINLDKGGNILWDKTLGDYTLKDNPHCSYIHLLEDGRLELRGHIVTEPAKKADDPEYHFWTSWLNNKGDRTQEIGDVIDWSDPNWTKFLEVK